MLNREAVKHLGLISKYQWQIIRDPSLRSFDSKSAKFAECFLRHPLGVAPFGSSRVTANKPHPCRRGADPLDQDGI